MVFKIFNKKDKAKDDKHKNDEKRKSIMPGDLSRSLFEEGKKEDEKKKNRQSMALPKGESSLNLGENLEEVSSAKINQATREIFNETKSSFVGGEAEFFRETMPKYETKNVPDDKVEIPVYILPEIKNDKTCIIKLHYHLLDDKWTKQAKFEMSMTLGDFVIKILSLAKNHKPNSTLEPKDVLIKARGTNEYIFGNEVPLYSFEAIRYAIEDFILVELNVVHVTTVTEKIENIFPNSGMQKIEYGYEIKGYKHEEISVDSEKEEEKVLSAWDMTKKPFKIVIKRLLLPQDLPKDEATDPMLVYVRCQLINGVQPFGESILTGPTGLVKEVVWNYSITSTEVHISDLFKDTQLLLTVEGNRMSDLQKQFTENINNELHPERIGWCRLKIFDHMNMMQTGLVSCRIWPGNYDNIPTTIENPNEHAPTIEVEFEKFVAPVVYPKGRKQKVESRIPKKQIDSIIHDFPLEPIAESDKLLLWNYRNDLKKQAKALPKVLASCDWSDYVKRYEMYELLDEWKKFSNPNSALELLDAQYQDPYIREYAVKYLESFSDVDLSNVILQLVETLKFECDHFSPLACYLLKRAIENPHVVGHRLFWSLRSQLENDRFRERFSLILEEYLSKVDKTQRRILENQLIVVEELLKIANVIISQPKSAKNEDLTTLLQKKLENIVLPKTFTTPLDIKTECCGIIIEKCKVMSSKKRPLKLTLKNADPSGDPFVILFKAGDDLRQDELTLQMLRVMDSLWKKEGLDLHINAYGCVSTSQDVGMIQWVLNSTTIGYLTQGVGKVVSSEPILNWIKEQCKTEDLIQQGIENFKHSCAGYLVATRVLGIGDRHNDNVTINNLNSFRS
jgi:hypothetical protein